MIRFLISRSFTTSGANLERNVAVVLEVVGEVDRGHPALTDLTLDAVAALEGGVEAGDGVWVAHLPKMPVRAVNREKVSLHGGERTSITGALHYSPSPSSRSISRRICPTSRFSMMPPKRSAPGPDAKSGISVPVCPPEA